MTAEGRVAEVLWLVSFVTLEKQLKQREEHSHCKHTTKDLQAQSFKIEEAHFENRRWSSKHHYGTP